MPRKEGRPQLDPEKAKEQEQIKAIVGIDSLLRTYFANKNDTQNRFEELKLQLNNTPYTDTVENISGDLAKIHESTAVDQANRLNQLSSNPLGFPLTQNGEISIGNLPAIGKGLIDYYERRIDWRTLQPQEQERLFWQKYNYAETISVITGCANPYKTNP